MNHYLLLVVTINMILHVPGGKITTLVDEWQEAGRHSDKFSEGAIHELPLQSSMYFYRIQIGNSTESVKLLLIR